MKLGVSSYSFNQCIEAGQMQQIDVIQKAKDLGYEAIEFINFILEEGETDETFAKRAHEESLRVGLPIISYTIGADLINGSDGNLELEINRIKKEVDIARILGATSFRHDATTGFNAEHIGPRSFETALPRLIEGCTAITTYAAQYGIRTMVENHGYFCQDSIRLEQLVSGVNHPNFGLLIDMGNFLCVDEAPEEAIGRLIPYAFHVHAKDFHTKSGMTQAPGQGWFKTRGGNYLRGAIIGHGDVPVKQCLDIIKNANYQGNLSVEFEGLEDPLLALDIALNNLHNYIDD